MAPKSLMHESFKCSLHDVFGLGGGDPRHAVLHAALCCLPAKPCKGACAFLPAAHAAAEWSECCDALAAMHGCKWVKQLLTVLYASGESTQRVAALEMQVRARGCFPATRYLKLNVEVACRLCTHCRVECWCTDFGRQTDWICGLVHCCTLQLPKHMHRNAKKKDELKVHSGPSFCLMRAVVLSV